MNDSEIDVLLRQAAERVPVSPPRVREMVAAERRGRQRTWVAGLAASVAVVVTAAGGVWMQSLNTPTTQDPAAFVDGIEPLPQPKGQWVGLGEIALDLPADWQADRLRCGQPTADTWTIASGATAVRTCRATWAEGVTAVTFSRLTSSGAAELAGDVDTSAHGGPVEVDGRPAGRMNTVCNPEEGASDYCSGNLYFADEELFVTVGSSRGAQAVDDVLATARVFPGYAGVPGFTGLTIGEYAESLRAAGLEVVLADDVAAERAVRAVEPAAGTMLPRGSAVTVRLWD